MSLTPVINITIEGRSFYCLIDSGSDTSLIKPNVLSSPSPSLLAKPLLYNTVNGIGTITSAITTSIPREFNISGTFHWKVVDFISSKYDAIIGRNFLVPLNAKIDLENNFLIVNSQRIPFVNNPNPIPPYPCQEIKTLEYSNIDEINLSHLNNEERRGIAQIIKKYKNLFFKEGDTLTNTCEIEHQIVTTTNSPIYCKIYRYPQIHEKEIERQIAEMLEQNIITHSNSPYNSPLWIVEKNKNNDLEEKKWRLVVDYRKLNEVTIDDKFPIPNIDAILDKLGRAQYFSTLDLAKGFHQILVREEDRKKTAFSTPFGH